MANLNFNKRDPIYLQVIEHFRSLLVSEQLGLGEELPSRRQIAQQFGINPNTVQRAFKEMEAKKWINTEPNRPSQVTRDPAVLKQIKNDYLKKSIREFVSSIQTIDITYEEVSALLLDEIKKQESQRTEIKEQANTKNGGINND